ncbi:hypothetical protein [Pacificoceanicola onchidii]|uniref:hypothetical protein n=1 Tax=Pacificoceanicola onchidii TaxID=2562685 RepID=UPI0010A3D5EE|nr:hypothetical protein [Pacificoceanicola onchidii]
MRDLVAVRDCAKTKTPSVPVDQIVEARRAFSTLPLSFEILLDADEAWQALEFCSKLARSEFGLAHVTYRDGSAVFLRLLDNPVAPAQELGALFAANPQVSLLRWTNVIGGNS